MVSSKESWLDVVGYEGLYAVSDKGRVKSLPKEIRDPNGRVRKYKERILKQQRVNKYGHLKVGLYKDQQCKEYLVHRLALTAFIGSPKDKEEGLHKDGDPTNNHISNLRWGTSKENSSDSIRHGTVARGSRLPQTKLTECDVSRIRKDARPSVRIAKDYGVSPRHIRSIKSKTCWVYLEEA